MSHSQPKALRTTLVIAATIAAVVGTTAPVLAQLDPDFDVMALRTPTSPAFVVLGVEPTTVERPSTPRAFTTSLLSATNGGSVIPENYALEIAPYWLTSRDALGFDEYFDPDLGQAILQTFSISLASSRAFATATDTASAVALGVRVVPRPGHPSRRLRTLADGITDLQRQTRRLPEQLAETEDSVAKAQDSLAVATTPSDSTRLEQRISQLEDRLQSLNSLQQRTDDSLSVMSRALQSSDHDRVGFMLQLAGGLAAAFPNNAFDGGEVSRIGLWGTLGYRIEAPRLDLLGLFRVQRNELAEQTMFDAGGRIIYEYARLSLSTEWVGRFVGDVTTEPGGPTTVVFESSSRLVGQIEYQVTNDFALKASFGQDFELAEGENPLIASLGLDLLLGALPRVLSAQQP